MLKNREIIKESVEKSIKWLLDQINPDGTINPVEKGAIAYYKIPWALILAGRTEEAKKVIDWIVRETMTPDGDIESDKRGKFHSDYYTYPNGWICLASHLLSLLDISYPLWNYISRFQDPHTGGYCSRGLYDPQKDNLEDAISTAWTSMISLHLGKIEEAKKAANFFKMLLKIQPNFQTEFYYYWYSQKGLVTQKPKEEPDERFIRINIEDREENWYYILGATIAFLSKLYVVTKDKEHLDLAKAYFDFAMRAPENIYSTESAGKLSYACTHLYYATGDGKYLQAAEKFMMGLLGIAEPEYYWIRGGKPTVSSTAEFCVWRYNILYIGETETRLWQRLT